MEEKKDREQITEQLEKNVFVEAGAGAGKTTLIVSRIVNQLKRGWKPESIVVITFTNAAAEELRTRIIRKVREGADRCTTEAEAQNLKKALQTLDRMNISTIHSFCYKLLQERLFDARLPMNVRLVEEEEAKSWKHAFLTDWAGEISSAEWQQLLRFGKNRWQMMENVEDLFLSICELPEDTQIKCEEIQNPRDYFNEAVPLANMVAQKLVQLAVQVYNQPFTNLSSVAEDKLLTAGKTIKELLLNVTPDTSFEVLEEIRKTRGNLFAKDKNNPRAESANEEYAEWVKQNVVAFIEDYKEELYTETLALAIKARKAYRKERPTGFITNDDLLQKTECLLQESEEARRYFAQKYRCIYVDEFQDTDQVQESFIWRLAATLEDDTRLRDGALFVVGDPKQSIYRFRGAQPEVYFALKNRMQTLTENTAVYCLDENFRSNKKIIEWVNKAFEERKICQEEYRPMEAIKKLPEKNVDKLLAGVYYYKGTQKKVSEKAAADIVVLSKLIRNLVDGKYQITEYNENHEPYPRAIRYSDFLVLCYDTSKMEDYQKQLASEGIPVMVDGKMKPNSNQALRRYVRLFDYLTHPYDRVKRVGAEEVLPGLEQEQKDRLLEKLKAETGEMSVHTIAVYLQKRLELLLPEKALISQSDLLDVQTKLEQMVEQVLSDDNSNSNFLSERFWAYLDKEIKHEVSLDEDADAVRFMNLHKAKGLEGNIVIIAKRDKKLKFKEAAYRKETDYYASASFGGNCMWSAYRKYPDIFAEAKSTEEQELKRLEYVAVTRPKQALIVLDAVTEDCLLDGYSLEKMGKEASVQDIVHSLPKQSETDEQSETEKAEAEQKKIPGEQRYTPEERIEADAEQMTSVFESSAPSSLENKSRGNAIRTKAKARYEKQNPDVQVVRTRPKGREWGNIMHRSLQLLIERWSADFEKAPGELENIINLSANQSVLENSNLVGEERLLFYKEFLTKLLQAFAQWAYDEKLLCEASRIYTELPFSFYEENIPGMESGPVWMNGKADLLIQRKDGSFLVLDYKSDNDYYMTEEEYAEYLQANYEGQISMYRYAVHRLFSVESENVSCGIISFAGENADRIRYTEM